MFPKFSLKSPKVWDLENEKEAQFRHSLVDPEAVYQPCEQPGDEEHAGCSKKFLVVVMLLLSLVLLSFGGVALLNYWQNESLHSVPRIGYHTNLSEAHCGHPSVHEIFDRREESKVYSYRVEVDSPAIRSTSAKLFVKDSLVEFYSSGKRVGHTPHSYGLSALTPDSVHHFHAEAQINIPAIYGPPADMLIAQFTMKTSRSESGPWTTFTFFHKYRVHCKFPAHDSN